MTNTATDSNDIDLLALFAKVNVELADPNSDTSKNLAAYVAKREAEDAAEAARAAARKKTRCSRCMGVGRLPHFSHVQGGVCFDCFGRGHG